jgi:hypothetical protein
MKSFLIAIALACAGTALASHAQQVPHQPVVDVSGLSAEQVALVRLAVDQAKKAPKENTLSNLVDATKLTPDKFKEWADAGQAAGKAVANFTKEVGIGADSFLKTDVGKYAFIAIAWKIGGKEVVASGLNVALSLLLAAILYIAWWKLSKLFVFGTIVRKEVEYNDNIFLRCLGFNKVKVTEKDWYEDKDFNESSKFWVTFWSRVICVGSLVAITWTVWPRFSF